MCVYVNVRNGVRNYIHNYTERERGVGTLWRASTASISIISHLVELITVKVNIHAAALAQNYAHTDAHTDAHIHIHI